MELIIISGPARVGKTTMANMLAKEAFEMGFIPHVIGFANPLKEEAEQRGLSKEENPKKYREFCQHHGALKREADPDYWVKAFESMLLNLYEQEINDLRDGRVHWERCVIVDDCRYLNEVSLGKKHRAINIFLSPGRRRLEDGNAEWRNHHSEALAKSVEAGNEENKSLFNYIMLNDGDEEDLLTKIQTMAPIWCNLQASFPQQDFGNMPARIQDIMEEIADMFFEGDDDDDPRMSDHGYT